MSPPAATIAGLLEHAAAAWPDREAVVFPSLWRATYGGLRDEATQAARSLAALGVRAGDHVGILMPNCPDFVVTFFGAQLLGAVVVPINTRFRARELGFVVADADLDVLVTTDLVDEHVDHGARVAESLPGLAGAGDPADLRLEGFPRLRSVVLLGRGTRPGMVTHDEFRAQAGAAEGPARPDPNPDDPALILYTSGTTANPKGCIITHDSVIGPWRAAARRLGIGGDDRMWDPLPLFHLSCLGPLLFMADAGGTLVTSTHFDPPAALADIAAERITWLYSIFPTITMALVTHPSFPDLDTSGIRGTLNSAPPDTMRVIQRAFPHTPNYGGHFGLTEASGAVTCHRVDAPAEERIETHGAALAGLEVRAIDPESGRDVPPGEPGELLVRGRGLMAGYYGDPDATAEAIRDGWLHTGDLGTISADGMVTFRSRLKDMLKVGGENVSPAEIESHLSTHPSVKLAQVVGAPDTRLGEAVAAFVEVVPGATLTADEVIAHCEGAIASFKVPRHVRFVEDWPMSATKIQKFRLRAAIAGELEGPS